MKKKSSAKKEKPVTHEQWIEVRREDNQFVSRFYPPNRDFETERLEKEPPPTLIYRRFHFVDGVPYEYNWTEPTETTRERGGFFLQRLLVADWLVVYETERQEGNRHAVSAENAQPRPEALGPCPCERCMAEMERPDD